MKKTLKITDDSKITIVDGDDWQAIFLDGKLITQDSHLSVVKVLKGLGVNLERLDADPEWMDEVGHFPNNLAEVKIQGLPDRDTKQLG